MVRPVEDARVVFHPTLGDVGWMILELADAEVPVREINETEFRRILRSAAQAPQPITTVDESTLWMFQEGYFWAEAELTQDEVLRELASSLLSTHETGHP